MSMTHGGVTTALTNARRYFSLANIARMALSLMGLTVTIAVAPVVFIFASTN
ncbi:MAG: hypothetical protein KME67_04935 [Candidatus Thiodiazotropha sp. (ex Codakia orbicularis)]|nr:hypothetical protein [Candidatus Thiodiazotropha sp. (ex Codakia orbicularis)]